MQNSSLAHLADFGTYFLVGNACALLYSCLFFCSALIVAGPSYGPRDALWPSGFTVPQPKAPPNDGSPEGSRASAAAAGTAVSDWRYGADPNERVVLLWDRLKRQRQELEEAKQQKVAIAQEKESLSQERTEETAQALQLMDTAVNTTEMLESTLSSHVSHIEQLQIQLELTQQQATADIELLELSEREFRLKAMADEDLDDQRDAFHALLSSVHDIMSVAAKQFAAQILFDHQAHFPEDQDLVVDALLDLERSDDHSG